MTAHFRAADFRPPGFPAPGPIRGWARRHRRLAALVWWVKHPILDTKWRYAAPGQDPVRIPFTTWRTLHRNRRIHRRQQAMYRAHKAGTYEYPTYTWRRSHIHQEVIAWSRDANGNVRPAKIVNVVDGELHSTNVHRNTDCDVAL